MHLKDFSLLETAPESCDYVLSSAYDLLPVNAITPEDKEEFALTMNGKKTHLRRNDLLTFAETAGIPGKATEMMIRKILNHFLTWTGLCEASLHPPDMKKALIDLIQERGIRIA